VTALAWTCLGLSALPLLLTLSNAWLFRRAADLEPGRDRPRVAILIPARDEAAGIAAACEAALASEGVDLEVLVGDDHSEDGTAAIVEAIASRDPRLRLERPPPPPAGWSGKGWNLTRLAERTTAPHLLFVDADTRLRPTAARRLVARSREGFALVSAVPRQIMSNLGTRLLVPMINQLIFGYYPLALARRFPRWPPGATGCGQVVLVDAAAYRALGGHAPVRASLHDGVTLPPKWRAAGYATDLLAGAELADNAPYAGFAEAWRGFAKNADEAMARPIALPVWTLLLAGAWLVPPLLAAFAALADETGAALVAAAAWALAFAQRSFVARLAREPLQTIPLMPMTVAVSLALQWRVLLGRDAAGLRHWRGRSYGRA
jgi:hypothetical protein